MLTLQVHPAKPAGASGQYLQVLAVIPASESSACNFLDKVDPDDIKELEHLTDDAGLQEAFWDLYQHSKSVLDYFGRHEFSDEVAHGLFSLIYHLESIRDKYDDRLENNENLVCRLNNFLHKVPAAFFESVYADSFTPMEFRVSPMSREKRRGLDLAMQVRGHYREHVEGKSKSEIDYARCNHNLAILISLSVIFGPDVDDDDWEDDPVISITHPLIAIYKSICNDDQE